MATDSAKRWNSPRPFAPAYDKPRRLTPEQVDELRARREAGESVKDLALAYGVSANTIRNYL